MRRRFGLIGTMAMGFTTLAPAMTYADDKPKAGLGPLQNLEKLEAEAFIKLIDTNNDGKLSQKEVGDAGNFLAGGIFFRADTNGDGVLTREEGNQARDAIYKQAPLLKLLFERIKAIDVQHSKEPQGTATNNASDSLFKQLAADPVQAIGNLLDSNHNQKIETTEVHQAVQTGVQVLFSFADKNQDSQLSPLELEAAVGELAKSTVQTVFQAADTDQNGSLSMGEYDKALSKPAHTLFRMIDANSDNQMTLAELEQAEQVIAEQFQGLGAPELKNSLSNDVPRGLNGPQTPRTPDQPTPGAPSPNATAIPAPR